LFSRDFKAIHVDVAASNSRAVRCYEKVGFCRVGELWRDAVDLTGMELDAPQYDFLRPHVRLDEVPPQLRFLLMECKRVE
jgi:ribosomal protein S18 acetylase RimI-like enzyme